MSTSRPDLLFFTFSRKWRRVSSIRARLLFTQTITLYYKKEKEEQHFEEQHFDATKVNISHCFALPQQTDDSLFTVKECKESKLILSPRCSSVTFSDMTFTQHVNLKFIEDENFTTRDANQFIGEQRAKDILCGLQSECLKRRTTCDLECGRKVIKYTVGVEFVLTTCSKLMDIALDTPFLSDEYKKQVAQEKICVDDLLAQWVKAKI